MHYMHADQAKVHHMVITGMNLLKARPRHQRPVLSTDTLPTCSCEKAPEKKMETQDIPCHWRQLTFFVNMFCLQH